ncbi:MAG: hypothetical protein H7318_04995 [Oligoflexus sp.]|nr:hypothetical protein [Oligoflexus sp.]
MSHPRKNTAKKRIPRAAALAKGFEEEVYRILSSSNCQIPYQKAALDACNSTRPVVCSRSMLADPRTTVDHLSGASQGIQFTEKNADRLKWQDASILASCFSSSSFVETEWTHIKFGLFR